MKIFLESKDFIIWLMGLIICMIFEILFKNNIGIIAAIFILISYIKDIEENIIKKNETKRKNKR